MAKPKKSRSNRIKTKTTPTEREEPIDIGTPELHQRMPTEIHGSGRDMRARVINNPLDTYLARELISEEQHFAGRQYYGLWYRAGHAPRFQAMNLLAIPGGTGDGENLMAMREKYHAATGAFRASLVRQTVFAVVCLGEFAYAVSGATSRSCEGRKGIINLRWGLDDLIHHFSRRKSAERNKGSIKDH